MGARRSVAKSRAGSVVVLAPAARSDIREALKWSEQRFGKRAALRYRALLKQALRDIAADPERPGSRPRPEIAEGILSYHLFFSRDRARTTLGVVREPRHFPIYRHCEKRIDVMRVLHDARDLRRRRPEPAG